ncbi:MAG: hypothetical protein WAV20_10920, partial [Blastocatellia bacterium]
MNRTRTNDTRNPFARRCEPGSDAVVMSVPVVTSSDKRSGIDKSRSSQRIAFAGLFLFTLLLYIR